MKRVLELLETERNIIETDLSFDKRMIKEDRGSELVKRLRAKSVRENSYYLNGINQAILILKDKQQ